MQAAGTIPPNLQEALSRGLLKRIPLTFLPFVNQQLHQWDYLFPNERKSVERLLLCVASLTPEQSSALFQDVVRIEDKMGVRNWEFSRNEQTIQNAAELARSPYFQEWRKAVQAVFNQADQYALKAQSPSARSTHRLVLLSIPRPLPVDEATVWRRWQGIGKPFKLDLAGTSQQPPPFTFLLGGSPGDPATGLFHAAQQHPEAAAADTWVIDATSGLIDQLTPKPPSSASPQAVLLSDRRLDRYRQAFSHEMNTMRKDLNDADVVYDHLRSVDVTPWCPPEVATDPAVREFVRSLYLSGNGAVIFGNSFVEWAASEAFRRARPRFLAARFGIRSKPKPFTGVAVFDNPDQINPLPSVDDLPGSSIDAQMLALYIWLAAQRFDEYRQSTICVCIAESIAQAYVIAPPEFALSAQAGPLALAPLRDALHSWLA